MKKLQTNIIIAFALLLSTFASAQQDYNKWSVGLNVGGHYGANPTTVGFPAKNIAHYEINGRYMINNRFGLMLDLGYDQLKGDLGTYAVKTNYIRTSLQGVVNLGDILQFHTFSKHIGLLAHGGAGFSQLTNKADVRAAMQPVGDKDKMANLIFGVRPQIKLGERVSLNMDVSYITHMKQNWNYDMLNKTDPAVFKNYMVNWSVGATFYLGKHSSHADWTPTILGDDNRLDSYENRIKKLEQDLGDNDGDGVFNYKDDEPNTPKGNEVDDRGVTIVKEPIKTETPTDKVPVTTTTTVKDTSNNALRQVNFEFGSDKLSVGSEEKIKEWIKVLEANPDYNLLIEGHTDNVSSAEFNQILSEKRAQSVYNLLLKNGLSSDRMITKGHNFSKPKVPNTNAKNRAINRRAEMKLIKK